MEKLVDKFVENAKKMNVAIDSIIVDETSRGGGFARKSAQNS